MARIECANVTWREIGDHVTFMGDVVGVEHSDRLQPLLYVDGRYAALATAPIQTELFA